MFPRVYGKGFPAFRISCVLLFVLGMGATAAGAAEIRLTPMLGIREEYNDNLFFDSSDASETRDRVTTFSPGIGIANRTERLNTLLQSRFTMMRYVRTDELDATDQEHTGRLSYLLSEKMRTAVEGAFTRDSRADRDIEATGLVIGTARRDRARYAFSADYTLSEKAGAALSYAYLDERFDSPDFVNSTAQDAGLGIRYDLSPFIPLAFARLNTAYGAYDFTDTHAVNYAVSAGASKQLSEAFSLSADIGRSRTRSSSETVFGLFSMDERTTERGTIGNLTLAYEGEQASATIALVQDVRALSGRPGTTRRTSARISISRRFTYELTFGISAEYFLNKTGREQTAQTEIDEQTLRIQPLITYHVTRDLTLNASYRFTRLKDDAADQRSIQSMGYLGVSWQYPVPR